jgi:diadenosine tetraphosphate (Ap4A) HIT family hydrolase
MDSTAPCPLCQPRPDDCAQWVKIAALSCSSLYLDRNQTYRGHCQLIYDPRHVEGLEKLELHEHAAMMNDLACAARAIARSMQPDHMNYVSLGNVVPHLHWHLVPRYRSDPRWGSPIYLTDTSRMPVTRLDEREYHARVELIRARL